MGCEWLRAPRRSGPLTCDRRLEERNVAGINPGTHEELRDINVGETLQVNGCQLLEGLSHAATEAKSSIEGRREDARRVVADSCAHAGDAIDDLDESVGLFEAKACLRRPREHLGRLP